MAELRISDLPAHSTGTLKATDLIEVSEESGGLFTSTKMTGASLNKNFANTDLTFTANRSHNMDDKSMILNNASLVVLNTSATEAAVFENDSDTYAAVTIKNVNGTANTVFALDLQEGAFRYVEIPVFADEAAAVTGGLLTGTVYKTSTGELRIKL